MNTLYIEKTTDTSWGERTNMPAIEKLLQENKLDLTPDKVERMPESYISQNNFNGAVQPDQK
jgi:hypothetical protein